VNNLPRVVARIVPRSESNPRPLDHESSALTTTPPMMNLLKRSAYDPSRSSEVVDFGTNRKRVYDFLFDLNSILGPVLPRFRDITAFVRRKPLFTHPIPISAKISRCSPWSRSVTFGLQRANTPGQLTLKLFSKNSNLCDHNTPTSQTDGETYRRHAIARPRFALKCIAR